MLLLTAFEPFDSTGLNSSEQALREFRRLYPHQIDGVPLAGTVLPVAFEEDVRALRHFCASLPQPPRAILHLGQTSGALVAVEQRAANCRFDFGSPRLTSEVQTAIDAGAPPFLNSTFPAEEIVHALQRQAIPCCASQDAGTYLCNHILFRSLQQAAQAGSAELIGFLHLPRLSKPLSPEQASQDAPTLPLQVLARAVEAAARVLTAHLK